MITDYDSIVDFRHKLDEAVANLNEKIRQTETAVEEVAAIWKDDIFKDFKEKFGEDKELLVHVNKELVEFNEQVLYGIQQLVREYLDNRF